MRYRPFKESVTTHKMPQWYDDCKFGIFIHWSLYSVPAFATPIAELGDIPIDNFWYSYNPYAEWYMNSLRIGSKPYKEYHEKNYGKDFDYNDFADLFTTEKWNPEEWAKLFKKAGAKYVIPDTKHHDGFCLWNSKYTDFNAYKRGPKRDLVADLCNAVRAEGLRFGTYYSALLDWQFCPYPVYDIGEIDEPTNCTKAYADYAYNQYMELIDNFKPDILWNDIGYPRAGRDDLWVLFAHYYNSVPEGIVNDRWSGIWHDYTTMEYKHGVQSLDEKWEMIRGMGLSFGYNQFDKYIDKNELVCLLLDCVSKGGNLLLNVGPKADGTIPQEQVDLLLYLGEWMDVNSEAIYGTKPWKIQQGQWGKVKIYYTKKGDDLYVTLAHVGNEEVFIPGLRDCAERARVLGNIEAVFSDTSEGLSVKLSKLEEGAAPVTFCVEGIID